VSDDSKTSDDAPDSKSGMNGGGLSGSKRSIDDASDCNDYDEIGDIELDPDKRREVRKMRRVMANRKSARESRERRKKLMVDLQDSVESLTVENDQLKSENVTLRAELASLIEQSGGTATVSMMTNLQGGAGSASI